jgi:hypothetical protein
MGDRARPKRGRGPASGSRLHEAAAAAARAGGGLLRAYADAPEAPPEDSAEPVRDGLREELELARRRLREVEEGQARALARAARRWEKERSALESQMTSLVQEIGAAKHIVERVRELEQELAGARAEVEARDEAVRGAEAARVSLVAEIEALRALLPTEARREDGAPAAGRAARSAAVGATRGTA